MELWKDIPANTDYQCSNLGRFRSKARPVRYLTKNGLEKYRNKLEKYIVPVFNHHRGYFYIALGSKCKTTAHRYIAMTFLDNFADNLDVDHVDGNRRNNNVSNLRMATRKENINNPNTSVYFKTRARDVAGRFL